SMCWSIRSRTYWVDGRSVQRLAWRGSLSRAPREGDHRLLQRALQDDRLLFRDFVRLRGLAFFAATRLRVGPFFFAAAGCTPSSDRHRYQLATLACGVHFFPMRFTSFGPGC